MASYDLYIVGIYLSDTEGNLVYSCEVCKKPLQIDENENFFCFECGAVAIYSE